jgi:hypothetical protein
MRTANWALKLSRIRVSTTHSETIVTHLTLGRAPHDYIILVGSALICLYILLTSLRSGIMADVEYICGVSIASRWGAMCLL